MMVHSPNVVNNIMKSGDAHAYNNGLQRWNNNYSGDLASNSVSLVLKLNPCMHGPSLHACMTLASMPTCMTLASMPTYIDLSEEDDLSMQSISLCSIFECFSKWKPALCFGVAIANLLATIIIVESVLPKEAVLFSEDPLLEIAHYHREFIIMSLQIDLL